MNIEFIQNNLWVFGILMMWELVWKGMALWKAAKADQRYWFIALVVVNSVGILPIAYLLLNTNKYRHTSFNLH